MDTYTLSYEGRARFKRTKSRMNMEGQATVGDFRVLDYLYGHGAATVVEIEDYTGLSWSQVVNKLGALIYWGYVEGLAGR